MSPIRVSAPNQIDPKLKKTNHALKAQNARLTSQVTELQAQVAVAEANAETQAAYADKAQAKADAADMQLQAKTDALSFYQGMLAKAEHDVVKCQKVIARHETDLRKLQRTVIEPSPVELHLRETLTGLYGRLTTASDVIADRDMEIGNLKVSLAKHDPGTIIERLVQAGKVEIEGLGTLTLSESNETGITVDFCLAENLRREIEVKRAR